MKPVFLMVNGEIDGAPSYVVKRGVTRLATVTFDGPRGTLRTHDGHLYADERKDVYRLHMELTDPGLAATDTRNRIARVYGHQEAK